MLYLRPYNGNMISAETTQIPEGEIYELLALMPVEDFDNDAAYARHVNEDGKDKIIQNHNNSINERTFWNNLYIILGLLVLLSPVTSIFTYFKWGREVKVDYDGIYER